MDDLCARLTPQQTPAPEEPNVYSSDYDPNTCAPTERDRQWYAGPTYVSLLWSEEESFAGLVLYKHYVPTGRGKLERKVLLRKQEVDGLLHRDLVET